MLKRFTDFVLRGRFQAIGSAFALSLIPLGGTLSILIAGLVTLRKGAFEGSLVLLAATLPYLIFISRPTDQPMLVLSAIEIIIISNVLTWLFAVILRQYGNWSFTLELSALLGILMICIVYILYPSIQDWWGVQLTNYFKTGSAAGISSENQAQIVAVLKSYAMSFVVVMILLNALGQLLLSRWWQAVVFNPGGLRTELHDIRLGYVTAIIFILCFVASYVGYAVALDIMPILYLTYCAAGLSLTHALIARTKSVWVWLGVIYLGLFFLFPFSVVMIALFGLTDTFVDFRKRVFQR